MYAKYDVEIQAERISLMKVHMKMGCMCLFRDLNSIHNKWSRTSRMSMEKVTLLADVIA